MGHPEAIDVWGKVNVLPRLPIVHPLVLGVLQEVLTLYWILKKQERD